MSAQETASKNVYDQELILYETQVEVREECLSKAL